jgi:hypothetical protein
MNVLGIVGRKARSWGRRSRFEQAWFGPTWLLLGVARVTILGVPFRAVAPRLGRHMKNESIQPLVTDRQRQRAIEIRRVIRLAARYTPWKSNCFPQAIAARVLLGLYAIPYALFFGLAKSGSDAASPRAHAWVCAGPIDVSGGDGFRDFTVVGTFVSADVANELVR